MQVSNGQIWVARKPLQAILNEAWPARQALALVKLAKTLDEYYAPLETVRQKLIRQYGTPNERGQIVVEQESKNYAKFTVEFNELLAEESEIAIEPVHLVLPDGEEMRLKPVDLIAAEPFVVIKEKTKVEAQ